MEKALNITEVMALTGWSKHYTENAMKTMRCIQIGGGEKRKRWGVTERELQRWQYENTVIPAEQKKPARRKRQPVIGTGLLEYRHSRR